MMTHNSPAAAASLAVVAVVALLRPPFPSTLLLPQDLRKGEVRMVGKVDGQKVDDPSL